MCADNLVEKLESKDTGPITNLEQLAKNVFMVV